MRSHLTAVSDDSLSRTTVSEDTVVLLDFVQLLQILTAVFSHLDRDPVESIDGTE